MQSMTKLKYLLIALLSFLSIQLFSQNNYKFSGKVLDEFNHPLTGAAISFTEEKSGAVTDKTGAFSFENISEKEYILNISFLGYKTIVDTLLLHKNTAKTYKLTLSDNELTEITVTESQQFNRNVQSSMSVDVVDRNFLSSNVSGSLMQTLSRLPGISSIDIGAGQSKPVIRGLGFSRVAVAENGIKHEAQEWGADHGLEIDQFTVERLDVIKGPASLMYGANAIGGVIDTKQILTPAQHALGGSVLLNMQSNNDFYGVSAKLYKRFSHFYYKTHFTYSDYSDYRVPTDSITYMTYNIHLKNRRLRNSAGRDRNGSLTMGYLYKNFSTHLSFTDNFSKSGFFANAHGVEIRTSSIDYDSSDRDIDLPSQQVNHFKVLSNTIWMLKDYKLNIDLGFQNNLRKEFSEAISHGYMPVPSDSLERLYDKSTLTLNLKLELPIHDRHRLVTGINTEYQNNKINGWGFILPEYRSYNAGAYVYDNILLTEKWALNAGLRFDFGSLNTDPYSDWYTTPQNDGSAIFVQRATGLNRNFSNISWGIGSIRNLDNITLKVNVGKSFRMPTAKELASNGINYHMYRFEKGDTTLRAEESYQIDFGIILKKGKWYAELTPFVNYFPNYIYLNPTSEYYEAQQIYYYSQSKVFRSGGEVVVNYHFTKKLTLSVDAEYIYSIQLSGTKKGYTLPFSPPFNSNIDLKYTPNIKSVFKKPTFGVNLNLVAAQNNIVPPEKKTAGYVLLNMSAGSEIILGKQKFMLNMQLNNTLNTRYYNHTSFYRLIEVPGQGTNLIVTLQMPFGN